MHPRPHDRTDRYAVIPPRTLPPWEAVAAEHRRQTHERDTAAAYKGSRLLAQAERMARRA